MSDFSVPVIKVGPITKHPNADCLSITEAEGCPVIIRTGDLKEGDLAVYIPVEAVVPLSLPALEFLKDPHHPDAATARIKAKRLRGVFSMGLLIPATAFLHRGVGKVCFQEVEADVSKTLGITKWEEPDLQGGQKKLKLKLPWWKILFAWIKHPIKMYQRWLRKGLEDGETKDPGGMPVYNVESIRKHRNAIQPGEMVYVSEKIHGCNARFCVKDGKFWVGSHRRFKKQDPNSWWWKAAIQEGLEQKLQAIPNMAVYGEVYGNVQDLKYGAKPGQVFLAVFDVYDTIKKAWLPYAEFVKVCEDLKLPRVPELYVGPYDREAVDKLAEGKSVVPGSDNIREGIVIKTTAERTSHCGRVMLKLVSEAYHLRKGGTEAQ